MSPYTLGDGINILGTLEPVSWSFGIKFLVIVSLKGKPASFSFLGVSELYSLFKYNKFELIRTERWQLSIFAVICD
jgi:hypothetical protein